MIITAVIVSFFALSGIMVVAACALSSRISQAEAREESLLLLESTRTGYAPEIRGNTLAAP